MPDASPRSIAVVGAGPRGVVLVDRIGAALEMLAGERGVESTAAALPPITLHLIDSREIGAGAVWETDQTRTLCMNTLAAAVTLFTEHGATITAPVRVGPNMYEWMHLVLEHAVRTDAPGVEGHAPRPEALAAIPAAHRDVFERTPPDLYELRCFYPEMAESLPQSHPSRALYGQYIRWALRVHLRGLPENVHVNVVGGRVTAIEPVEGAGVSGRDRLVFDDGRELLADLTVVTGGWVHTAPTTEEAALARAVEEYPGLVWLPPDSPIDQDFAAVPDGAEVLVRGLGMGFFDAMALLTYDRGGVFEETPGTRSGLTYRPSGREPRLLVASNRGYPFLPKSDYGGLPPKPVLRRLGAVVATCNEEGHEVGAIDYAARVWPAILADAFEAYYRTLARVSPELLRGSLDDLVAAIDSVTLTRADVDAKRDFSLMREAVAPFVVPVGAEEGAEAVEAGSAEGRGARQSDRYFEPDFLLHPTDAYAEAVRRAQAEVGRPGDAQPGPDLTEWIAQHLVDDLAHVALGEDSPWRAGLWEISAARRVTSLLGAGGRYEPDSKGPIRAVTGIGGMAGSGPPAFRTRELLALIDAGLVTFVGAAPVLAVEDRDDAEATGPAEVMGASGARGASGPAFVMTSATRPHEEFRSRVLVDAWMHTPDIRRPGEQLWQNLLASGRIRPFTLESAAGAVVTLGSPEVDPATGRVVRADGTLDSRLHLVGIPLVELLGDAMISPMPGSDPTMLREADRVGIALARAATGLEAEL